MPREFGTEISITPYQEEIVPLHLALLRHPEYRTKYAANLKRELPRIPYASAFAEYARIGQRLMDIHIHYEQQPEYPLALDKTGHLNWPLKR